MPPTQRPHCVATFLRMYELLCDVASTLPLLEVRPARPRPTAALGATRLRCASTPAACRSPHPAGCRPLQATPPVPTTPAPTAVTTSLLKYLLAQHLCPFDTYLACPGYLTPRVMAQLHPLWNFTLVRSPFGPPTSAGVPSPALGPLLSSRQPLAEDEGGTLLAPLLKALCLANQLSLKAPYYEASQRLLAKVLERLTNPASAARLERELAELQACGAGSGH